MEYPAGWSCEVVLSRLDDYLLQVIALTDALALAEHVEACSGCGQQLVVRRLIVLARAGRG
jgi:hypothetical protein